MNALQKNWLFPNKTVKQLVIIFIALCFIFIHKAKGQKIGNYVFNGSFEEKYDCNPPYALDKAKGWCNLGNDTTKYAGALYSVNCFSNAPNTGSSFQYPHTGDTYYRFTTYCLSPCPYEYSRSYPKNRLKSRLIIGKTYCVKMLVNLEDLSPYASSNFSFLFGDNSLDTIHYSNRPITYLNPQVSNPITNIVVDTMNWVAISGTFVATGNEKYLVLGNFYSNTASTTSFVNSSLPNVSFAEYFIDDVSCIEVNLPAYAGADKSVIPGDSVYIGRELDFAVDSGCTWFKLPNTTTSIKKASGLWVKPTSTSTYVVKQVLECSSEKWDTVVVYMNPLGIVSSSGVGNDLKLFPNPANDFLELSMSDIKLTKDFNLLEIYNNLGILIEQKEIYFDNTRLKIETDNFPNGVYFLRLKSVNNETLSTRFMVAR